MAPVIHFICIHLSWDRAAGVYGSKNVLGLGGLNEYIVEELSSV